MKVFQIRQDDRFAWYETDQEQMERMVNVCGWQGRVLELASTIASDAVSVTAAELSCVINWLEGGRDPKDAAKELRLYCERAWTGTQPVQQPAPVAADERAAFESLCRNNAGAAAPLQRSESGAYCNYGIQAQWVGWEARSAIAQRAAPVAAPVAWKEPWKWAAIWYGDPECKADQRYEVLPYKHQAEKMVELRRLQGFHGCEVRPVFAARAPAASVQPMPEAERIAQVVMHMAANDLIFWRGTGNDEDDAWNTDEEYRTTLAAVKDALAALQPAQQTAPAKDEEVLALHRKLAAETLRADQGWQRYEEANRDRNSLRADMAATAQQGGGEFLPYVGALARSWVDEIADDLHSRRRSCNQALSRLDSTEQYRIDSHKLTIAAIDRAIAALAASVPAQAVQHIYQVYDSRAGWLEVPKEQYDRRNPQYRRIAPAPTRHNGGSL